MEIITLQITLTFDPELEESIDYLKKGIKRAIERAVAVEQIEIETVSTEKIND